MVNIGNFILFSFGTYNTQYIIYNAHTYTQYKIQWQIAISKITEYKQNQMNNPLIKNNKTWLLNDLQHRTSHYNRILGARSLYNVQSPKRQSLLSYINCKSKNNAEIQRRITNRKLVNSLLDIQRKDSRYAKQSHREPQSLKNQHLVKQQNNKIMGENLELFKKIVNANSSIGSKKKWKSRKKQLNAYGKLLDNKRQAYLNLDQQFYNAYSRLRNKKSVDLVIKVQSKIWESQRVSSLRLKKARKCYTEPFQLHGLENNQQEHQQGHEFENQNRKNIVKYQEPNCKIDKL